ncbi:MAG: type II toxin-antitoxin system MqsA family antitoxin [Chloroflexi bacterium]|nr:type II toxin-antitoxin system MqsA family antitoxin [Chloroflexota bacterium]
MFECDVCGAKEAREELVTEVFEVDGRRVLVENIPALVCSHCGELVFSQETTEKVRRIVHGEAEPIGVVQLDVFAYA